MKWFSLVLLTAFAAPPLWAQTEPPANAPPAPPAFASAHPSIKAVARPPASIMPSPQARLSTAQRMAAANNQPPLTQLPAFTATDQDGHAVTAKTVSRTSHWLLIYRKQNCLPCDRLMNVLAASESASLKTGAPYVILVAGKSSEALARVRANYAGLTGATWLADRDDRVFALLKPRGAPMIYAIDGSKVAWSIPGNLGNPAKVEKMAASWVATGAISQAAIANTSSAGTVSGSTPN
jgi:hypothetical protein